MKDLDLMNEFDSVLIYLKKRISEYTNTENNGPGNSYDNVSLITFGFSFEHSGWYALVFDTRPNASPDGEWQSYIEGNCFNDQLWCLDDVEELSITHYKKNWRLPDEDFDDDYFAYLFGELLKDVLIFARENNLFSGISLAKNCVMNVEEHEGRYGWPNYEERFKIGKVV